MDLCHKRAPSKTLVFYYNLVWGLQTLRFKIQKGQQYNIHFHVPQYISIFCAIHILAWLVICCIWKFNNFYGVCFFLMEHRTMDDESQNSHPSLTFSLQFWSLQLLSVPHCTALYNQYHSKRYHEADFTSVYIILITQ